MTDVAIKAEETNIDSEYTQDKEIKISAQSGFYNEDIQITAQLGQEGIVFYTMDGSCPASEEGGSTYRYREPILLSAGEEESVEVCRFKAVFDDGTESEVVTNTYFMGKDIWNRYDTMIISLAAEYDDLYGEERGIFVEGKLRADWLAEHPGEEVDADTPANYNMRGRESERNVHIEIFERDGSRVISQNGGIRISGGFTRWSEQKSFKLYARKEYDEQNNRFRFPLLDDMRTLDGGTIIGKYKTIKIRNTGNDRLEAFIRDELG
ncbi:MAG: chitobiase/beta-hexosaminidase C-terminal domain-containing protein, partial [Lachnospiraceae bacterium]|nr:chitobiase/beta-hexosaminidase C-terminal domain-containing protein [Lachnospiraceae bacterium]